MFEGIKIVGAVVTGAVAIGTAFGKWVKGAVVGVHEKVDSVETARVRETKRLENRIEHLETEAQKMRRETVTYEQLKTELGEVTKNVTDQLADLKKDIREIRNRQDRVPAKSNGDTDD